ncbi:hypothetical protein C1646_773254 [Rhizophagus diaphanus]|nr:hypothetical protein C1646_773254 [Rhizophagus diaphanus] [Rhizophagus sp. MUCL 43196]
MTSIRNYYNSVLVEKDKRDLVKAQHQFKERCIETVIQTYQSSLRRISKNSDYENSENESPTESENKESSYEDLSDNDTEEEERAMSPIPYPYCNEIHCICYDQVDTDKEYEEYCQNYDEQTAENP